MKIGLLDICRLECDEWKSLKKEANKTKKRLRINLFQSLKFIYFRDRFTQSKPGISQERGYQKTKCFLLSMFLGDKGGMV